MGKRKMDLKAVRVIQSDMDKTGRVKILILLQNLELKF